VTGRRKVTNVLCPLCGGESVPIEYGEPSAEGLEASDRGEVILGGCIVWDEMPTVACRVCDHSWSGSEA